MGAGGSKASKGRWSGIDRQMSLGSGWEGLEEGWAPSGEREVTRKISKSGYDITPITAQQRAKGVVKLTELQQLIAFEVVMEPGGSGVTVNGYPFDNQLPGIYVGAIGGLPLFSSSAKLAVSTGWPLFSAPIDPDHILEIRDIKNPSSDRVDVLDARSGAHLGYAFSDGTKSGGRRYCVNAGALIFYPRGTEIPLESKPLTPGEAARIHRRNLLHEY